jgi:hypothetical protein
MSERAIIMWGGFWAFEYDTYGAPYRLMAEKSQAAERREALATTKFNATRVALQSAMISNKVRIVLLGCKADDSSCSLFAALPTVCVDHILDYLRAAVTLPSSAPEAAAAAPVAAMASSSSGDPVVDALVAKRSAKLAAERATAAKMKSIKKQLDDEAVPPPPPPPKPLLPVDEIMKQLYTPGNKIVLPITKPDCHLTGPCWRDFSRHVRSLDGGACWNVKRIAATAQEKIQYHESHRQGKVYFIQAIYTVPGVVAAGGAAKKTKTQQKKRPATAASKNKEKKAPPSSSVASAAAQGSNNNDDDDDFDFGIEYGNVRKPSAKKLKTTTTTSTTSTSAAASATASATASALQQE